jgi:hypothetical protein
LGVWVCGSVDGVSGCRRRSCVRRRDFLGGGGCGCGCVCVRRRRCPPSCACTATASVCRVSWAVLPSEMSVSYGSCVRVRLRFFFNLHGPLPPLHSVAPPPSTPPLQRNERRASNNKIRINPQPRREIQNHNLLVVRRAARKKEKKEVSVWVPVFSPSLTHLTIRRPSNFTSKIWLVWLSRTTRIAPLPPPALALAAPPLPAPHSAPRSHTRTLRS